MKDLLKHALAALFTLGMSSGGWAQFSGSNEVGQQPTTGAFGQQDSFSNVTTSFDGIDVQVMRLIKDPAGDGTVRLILRLTSTADEDRRLLFVAPVTTLIDELGNEYRAVDAVGVEICGNNRIWDGELDWCRRFRGEIATRIAPAVPVTVAVMFKPSDENYSKELADMSQTVSLRSRIGYFPNDFASATSADIIVNDIPFPR